MKKLMLIPCMLSLLILVGCKSDEQMVQPKAKFRVEKELNKTSSCKAVFEITLN